MKALKLAGLALVAMVLVAGCDKGGKKRGDNNPYGYNNYGYNNQNCVQNGQGQWIDRTTGQISYTCQNNGYSCQAQNYDRNMCYRQVNYGQWIDINGRPVPQGVNCDNQCNNGFGQNPGYYPPANNGYGYDECTVTYGPGSYRVIQYGQLWCTSPYMYQWQMQGGVPVMYNTYGGYQSNCSTGRLGPFYGYICL